MSDLEDDIELDVVPEVVQPRKLSRLKRVDAEARKTESPEAQNNTLAAAEVEPNGAAANSAGGEAEAEDVDGDGADDGEEAASERGAMEQEEEYWDEEDEIEKYLQDRFEGVSSSDDEDAATGAGEGPADRDAAPPLDLGNSLTMADLNAETQRILRETAARDRLGKGQKIEIKPMSSIIERLRERRALAISRAPKPSRPRSVVDFDDVLAAATEQAAPATGSAAALASSAAPTGEPGTGNAGAPGVAELHEEPGGAAAALDAEEDSAGAAADLDIVSEDEDAEGAAARVVELPSTAKKEPKPSPLAYLPYTQSRELEFEEEVLLEDGAGSDDDSDDGSERSWEVRGGGDEGAAGAVAARQGGDAGGGASEAEEEEEEEEEDSARGAEAAGQEEVEDDAHGPGGLRADRPGAGPEGGAAGGAREGPSPVGGKAVAGAAPKHARRLQRVFLDMEAELSDEDGAAGSVSEDEDEDEVDDRGELGDLIASGDKERGKDKEAKELLHRSWEQQKDAKELQQVLRGLEQGFRRRRGGAGALESEDEELDGRRRRARLGGEEEEEEEVAGGGWGSVMWPAAWGVGGDGDGGAEEEELDGEELLRRAKQQRLLAESRGPSQLSPGAVPLDEDSQAVLGMLRFSESQQGGAVEAGRGPSFLGRQPSVARATGALGLGGGKSFVFGQRDCSNSGVPDAARPGSQGARDEPEGPVSFANLRQMAGLPCGGAGSKRQRGGASSLVSRLGGVGKAAPPSQPAVDAARAFCQHVLAPQNRRRK